MIVYGPAILSNTLHLFRRHSNIALSIVGGIIFAILVYVLRKVFDKRRGTPLPVEEQVIVVTSDDSL